MIRRWLRGCLLPSALCLSAVGCTASVESLTNGLSTSWSTTPKDSGSVQPARASDDLPANDQLRLHLSTAQQLDRAAKENEALAEYERVLSLDPANFTAMRRLAVLYDCRGSKEDFKKAEEFYRKLAKARPGDPDIWSDWGYSLYLRTDKETYKANWGQAEEKLRHALQLNPKHAKAHSNLGLVLGQMERYDEAFREFRAAELSESEAHNDMAFIYLTKGRMEDAKHECRVALDKDPTNGHARKMLEDLEHPSHARDMIAGAGKHDGRGPRASQVSQAQWEAERDAARKAAGGSGSATAPAPAAEKPVSWESSGPYIMPAGWVPVHPSGSSATKATPAPQSLPALPPAPVPAGAGTPGMITLE